MNESPFLGRLEGGYLLADGGLGTQLYAKGIHLNACFDELNLSRPDLVAEVHREYVEVGADLIETNTFGANRFKLEPFGLDTKVDEINRAAVAIAREVARGHGVLVAGSVGPIGRPVEPLGKVSREDALASQAEQIGALVRAGVDLLMIETMPSLAELEVALLAATAVPGHPPIVALATFDEDGSTLMGDTARSVAVRLDELGADVIGANCSIGPQPMLDVLVELSRHTERPLAALPNAGLPRMVDDRFLYVTSPEYMGKYARRFLEAGTSLIGGCCGTTPAHVQAMRGALEAFGPKRHPVSIEVKDAERRTDVELLPPHAKSPLGRVLAERRFAISVEIAPPRGLDTDKVIAAALRMKEVGVDAINIPDGPRATARMSHLALALHIMRATDIDIILHYCCRDRNLLGIQSDLLGAYTLGLRNILAITGDPPKMGDYPDATAVFDLDSIGLVKMLSRFNHGLDLAGNPLDRTPAYHVGVGANPGALDRDRELERLRDKLAAGAEYILTQPVYDGRILERFLEDATFVEVPVLAGILPLSSHRNAEFLHNEVPGMAIPEPIRERMRKAGGGEKGRAEGVAIARDALREVRTFVQGAYIMPPLGRYELAAQVLEALEVR